jgi:hypothetical protein
MVHEYYLYLRCNILIEEGVKSEVILSQIILHIYLFIADGVPKMQKDKVVMVYELLYISE